MRRIFKSPTIRIAGPWRCAAILTLSALSAVGPAGAACNDTPTIQNFTGGGRVACPCFVTDERAAAVFSAPASDYPIEILRVGIGWGSQFGGTPSSLEHSIEIYGGGLPNPGTPIFTLEGPVLNDGAINQFDLEPLAGQITVNSGPFAVALRFLNESSGNPFAPSVVHDGNGCQAGKNMVYAIPGGWSDACGLGVSGDWLFFVVYRSCATTDVGEPIRQLSSVPVALLPPRPNPCKETASFEFILEKADHVRISLQDICGRRVAILAEGDFTAGNHRVVWNTRSSNTSPGLYVADLTAGEHHARRTLILIR